MTEDWRDRAWRQRAGRPRRYFRSGDDPPALRVVAGDEVGTRWYPRSDEERVLFDLAAAGLLGGSAEGPMIAKSCPVAPCPVCGHPTANGWWVQDEETHEWLAVTFPPTPCTRCRAVILSAGWPG
jgi:hypothetical protein